MGECIGQHQSSKKPLHVVPTQRSFSRPTSRATQRLGGQDEEALAGGLFSASVRVPRQTSPAVSTVASAGAATRTGSGFKAREAGPKVFTPMKTAFFKFGGRLSFAPVVLILAKHVQQRVSIFWHMTFYMGRAMICLQCWNGPSNSCGLTALLWFGLAHLALVGQGLGNCCQEQSIQSGWFFAGAIGVWQGPRKP